MTKRWHSWVCVILTTKKQNTVADLTQHSNLKQHFCAGNWPCGSFFYIGNSLINVLLCFWYDFWLPDSWHALMSSSWATEFTFRLELALNVFHPSRQSSGLYRLSVEKKELQEVTPGSLEPLWGPWIGIAPAVTLWGSAQLPLERPYQNQPAEQMIWSKKHITKTFKCRGERWARSVLCGRVEECVLIVCQEYQGEIR